MPCVGLSRCEPRALRRTGFRSRDTWAARGLTSTGSKARVPRLSCSMAGGIFSDQGWNPCLLHRQADSLPRSHQGSPVSGLSCSPNLDLGFVSFLQSIMSCPTSRMSYFVTRFGMDIRISYQVLGVDWGVLAFIPAVNVAQSGLKDRHVSGLFYQTP